MSRHLDTLILAGQQIFALRAGRDGPLGSLAREIFDGCSGDVRASIAEINRRLLEAAVPCAYVHDADDRHEGVSDETA